MFEREYENPMVLGDYGESDEPEQEAICPICGRLWSGYETDDDRIEWDCTDDAYVSAFTFPTSERGCLACAWELHTTEQTRAFIKDQSLQVDVLEYLLCTKSTSRISHHDSAQMLWDMLIETEDDVIRSWVNDLIRDYIHDEEKTEFSEWIVEGGYDRVCVCAGGENNEQQNGR